MGIANDDFHNLDIQDRQEFERIVFQPVSRFFTSRLKYFAELLTQSPSLRDETNE
jgi:hypothetical protein